MSTNKELSESVGVPLTPEQKRKLRLEAAEHGMNMAEYVRSQLFDD